LPDDADDAFHARLDVLAVVLGIQEAASTHRAGRPRMTCCWQACTGPRTRSSNIEIPHHPIDRKLHFRAHSCIVRHPHRPWQSGQSEHLPPNRHPCKTSTPASAAKPIGIRSWETTKDSRQTSSGMDPGEAGPAAMRSRTATLVGSQ
jgi:hypothetical protein